MENLSEDTFEKACNGIFAEPPVDVLYLESFPVSDKDHVFSVEYLPGQFDQRADSAEQCVQFIKEDESPVIKTATTYVIEGNVTEVDQIPQRSRITVSTLWTQERQGWKNRKR